jgi:hypothetical protein
MVLRPDPVGALDLLSGVMLWFTVSPLPAALAAVHSGFLIVKGTGTIVEPVPLRAFGLPFFVIGGAVDLMSAAILYVGTPPFLVDYKSFIALFLGLKGLWTLMGFMQ